MKVLFFNYEYPPLGGGAANASFCLLQEFSKLPDLEVDFVTSSIDSEYHLERMGSNVRIHRLPIGKNSRNLHFQSQKDLLAYAWKAYRFSRKLIRESGAERYDLTHSFFTVPCGYLSYSIRKTLGIPYIVSLRGSDVPGYSDRFTFIYDILKPLIVRIWRSASAVISNSQGLKELALESDPEREIGIIYNGVDIDRFCPDGAKKDAKRFVITPGASRITTRKGLDFLVRAVAELVPDHPEILLRIMGEGNEEKNLRNLVEELKIGSNVEFLGRIPNEKVTPHYQEADVFVLPSLNEGMSNAMLEALATGLPIVTTDTGGASELVREGENGFIVPFKDSQAIAGKVRELMDDRELLVRMSEKSREIAKTMSWKAVAEQYSEEYRKAAEKKR